MKELKLTKENFTKEVLQADKPVLVDFWAPWCGPCRMASPIVEEIAQEYSTQFKVGKVNVDEEPELAAQFQVMSIPAFKVFRNGKLAKEAVGLRPKAQLIDMLREGE